MSRGTAAYQEVVRTRLLDFQPASGGSTLRTRLGGGATARLYVDVAPDAPTYPYAVLRLRDRNEVAGFHALGERVDVELDLFHRPRGKGAGETVTRTAALDAIADLCDEAMRAFRDVSDGWVWFAGQRRRTKPEPDIDPLDRELVFIRLVYPLGLWPSNKTRYLS